jgi:lactoylglutathione lyase
MAKLEGLAHVGVFIADIERSKQFYAEILDFELIYECTLDDKNGPVKLAFLRNGNLTLELVQFADFRQKADGTVDHFAIAAEDIEKVCEALIDRGIAFETKEIGYASNVFANGCKGIFFRGPDNERIEIVEILTAAG